MIPRRYSFQEHRRLTTTLSKDERAAVFARLPETLQGEAWGQLEEHFAEVARAEWQRAREEGRA